jgi:putative ABC transport system permease protein
MALAVRGSLPAESLVKAVRSEVRALEASQPVHSFRLFAEYRSLAVAHNRFAMLALAGFGFVALVLSVLGIYGVIAFGVSERAQEIGIRIALGASPGDVLRSVLLQGLGLIAPGLAIGLAVSAVGTRALRSLLFGVSPLDFATFAFVSGLLLLVGTAACWHPGRRAASIAPSLAMREE